MFKYGQGLKAGGGDKNSNPRRGIIGGKLDGGLQHNGKPS